MELQVRHLGKTFGSGQHRKEVLRDISFGLRSGEFLALVGSSGSGKSTILRLIAGLEQPSSGQVLVDGAAVQGPGPDRGMVFQKYSLYPWLSAAENVAFGISLELIDQNKVHEVLRLSNLHHFVNSLQDGINSNVGERGLSISGGQKQRLALARALYRQPKVLILDEFTSALDAENEKTILNTISNLENTTIILISHTKTAKDFCVNSIELISKDKTN